MGQHPSQLSVAFLRLLSLRPNGAPVHSQGASAPGYLMGLGRVVLESIPNISFIPFEFVPPQEVAKLFLVSCGAMMRFLIGQVRLYLFDIGIAHCKRAVAVLPPKIVNGQLIMHPARRVGFDESNRISHRDCPAQRGQQMHMVWHSAGGDQSARSVAQYSPDVFKQARLDVALDHRLPVLGAKHDVAMKRSERLRHG